VLIKLNVIVGLDLKKLGIQFDKIVVFQVFHIQFLGNKNILCFVSKPLVMIFLEI